MAKPRVSVIIPTFQHRDFILRTLESVFEQTLTDYELIVVNDGSTDDTHSILAPLVEAGRITYIEQENHGQSRARNVGMSRARGEYIAFLDDDDLWPTNKLSSQVAFLDANPSVGMVGGTFRMIDEDGIPGRAGPFYPAITFETLFTANPFHSPGQTLIRAALLNDVGGLNATIWGADDWDLWFRIAKRSTIVMRDEVALYYRLHARNASKQTARLLRACCETIELHLHTLDKRTRNALRRASHRTIYEGLGCHLVSAARNDVLRGRLLAAVQTLRGVSPLRRGILFDSRVRRAFLRDVVNG
jgi:glycosyltransferase involved in cell wall biosynthesis